MLYVTIIVLTQQTSVGMTVRWWRQNMRPMLILRDNKKVQNENFPKLGYIMRYFFKESGF